MKVVINKCFGGFGVSGKAMIQLLESNCGHTKTMTMKEYYGHEPTEDDLRFQRLMPDMFLPKQSLVLIDEHDIDSARCCEHLVRVVETLKEESYGSYAKLMVIDIPITNYTIHEYDGMESVEEVHRSWG